MVVMDIAELCAAARDVRLMHFVSVNLRLSSTSETEDKTLLYINFETDIARMTIQDISISNKNLDF